MIVVTKFRGHWFVIHGFAKNVQANIDAQQLADLKVLSKALLFHDDLTVERAVGIGVIRPITNSGVKPRRSGRGYKPRKPGADFI